MLCLSGHGGGGAAAVLIGKTQNSVGVWSSCGVLVLPLSQSLRAQSWQLSVCNAVSWLSSLGSLFLLVPWVCCSLVAIWALCCSCLPTGSIPCPWSPTPPCSSGVGLCLGQHSPARCFPMGWEGWEAGGSLCLAKPRAQLSSRWRLGSGCEQLGAWLPSSRSCSFISPCRATGSSGSTATMALTTCQSLFGTDSLALLLQTLAVVGL